MNRFKILKIPELKPCFAPVDPSAPKKKVPSGTLGQGPVGVGYTGIVGTPVRASTTFEDSEAARDFQAMHGVVVARTGLRSNPGRFR